MSISSVDKRTGITQKELIHEYVKPGLPVVLTDATKKWNNAKRFTPEYFKEKYGHIKKQVKGTTYTLAEYVDLMKTSTPENPAPYPFNFNIEKFFPELLDDFRPEVIYGESDRINHPMLPRFMLQGTQVYEFFFGGNGSSFPVLHIDVLCLSTQITQLYGAKDFYLYPPDQTKYLYPSERNSNFSQINIFKPDYERFPLFKEAKPLKVTVNQGETILFPAGWWHTTQINEQCISMGRVQMKASDWNNFINYQYTAWRKKVSYLASPVLAYGKIAGSIMSLKEKEVA